MTRASTRRSRCRPTPCGRRSRAGSPPRPGGRRPTSAPYRLLDVGCGEMPYLAALRAARERDRRDGHGRQPAREPDRADRGDPGAPTPRSTSCSAPRCSSTSTTRRRASASSHRVTRPGGRVLLSTHGAMVYHPNPVDLLALDRGRPRAAVPRERRLGFGYGVRRLRHGLLPRDAERHLPRARPPADAAAPGARARRLGAQPRRAGARPARLAPPRRAPRDDRRQLPRRRGPRRRDARPRHRRRRLHRLEPRRGAARARRRRPRARQLLDRQPGEPRRARPGRRGGRGRPPLVRARAHGRPRRRGRLPPGRARLGAALGAGPADVDRGQRRGHAQRAARRPRRGRSGASSPRRRRPSTATAERSHASRRRRRTRSRPTPSRSSPRSGSASASRGSTGSRPSRCATSTSSGRVRTRPRSTRRSCRASSARSPRAGPSPSTATASSRATSPTSRTSSRRTCSRPTRRTAAGTVLNVATGGSETVNALADTIGRLLDRPVEKTFGAGAARGRARVVGGRLAPRATAIGYEPRVGFEEGLRRTIDSHAARGREPRDEPCVRDDRRARRGLRLPQGAPGARRRGVRRQRRS